MFKKFLLIQLRKLGDVLLTTPVIDILKENLPDAQIDFLTEPPYIDLLTDNPKITNVYTVDKSSVKNQIKTLLDIRKEKYDYVLDFFCNPRSAWWAFLSSADCKIGFDYPGRKWLYDVRVPRAQYPKYNVDFKLDLLQALDIKSDYHKLSLYVKDDIVKKMEQIVIKNGRRKNRPLVGIVTPNNRGVSRVKNWRIKGFASLIEKIIYELDADVLILWGPGEEDIAERLWNMIPHDRVIMSPHMSIKELGAIISQCSVIVTACGGSKHIAVAMDVPTVTIFGPTQEICWNPPSEKHIALKAENLECLGCDKTECRTMDCMKLVSVDMVFDAVKKLCNKEFLCEV